MVVASDVEKRWAFAVSDHGFFGTLVKVFDLEGWVDRGYGDQVVVLGRETECEPRSQAISSREAFLMTQLVEVFPQFSVL